MANELLENLDRLHTTELGVIRIKKNLWIIGLIVLFSVLVKSYTGVLLGTGGSVLGVYLISFFPKAWKYTPTTLMESASLLIGTKSIEDYGIAVLITILLVVICLIVSITVMNRKQL